jgi:hypothetical protein
MGYDRPTFLRKTNRPATMKQGTPRERSWYDHSLDTVAALEGLDPVDRLKRIHPVDRKYGIDPVHWKRRIVRIGRLGIRVAFHPVGAFVPQLAFAVVCAIQALGALLSRFPARATRRESLDTG